MGIFRQFPYSNFHDMNMDEIITIVKNMLEEWAQYYAEWDAWMAEINEDWSNYQEVMNEAWENMQSFINNYFDNLDVQVEINNKITSMVLSGEFATIVEPYIPPRVTEWLAANITQPVGVVIDTSLSVAGACADAKATGDKIAEIVEDFKSESVNLINPRNIEQFSDYVRVELAKEEIRIHSTQAGTYKRAKIDLILEPNTTYTISCIKETISGAGWIAYCESTDSGATYPSGVQTLISKDNADDTLFYNSFTTTTGYVRLSFYCTYSTSVLGDITFKRVMLNKGEYYGFYEPFMFADDYEARHTADTNKSMLEYVYKLKQGTLIESEADLNYYITAGSYVANSGTLARSLSNCPTRMLFSMQVEYLSLNDNSYIVQHITDLTGNEYIRARQGDVFTSWRQVNTGMSNFGTMLKTSLNGSIPTTQTTAYDADNVEHTVYKSAKTYSEFITDTWDTLVASYPTKVAKTQIGMDSSNTYPIYKYVITPEYYSRTVLITAGMHGCECEAMYGLYRMMRYWLRSYDVMLGRKIKYDTRFVIIPVVNPWGMMNVDTAGSDCGRNCSLGIQPYRDFPNSIDTASTTSEADAVRDVMSDYNFDYYVDLHTDPFTTSKGCYGYALDNSKTRGALYNITRSFYYVILKEYSYSESIYDGVIPHNQLTSTVPSRYAENLLNIPANLLEVAIGGFAEPSSTWTMKAAVDWYMNVVSDMLDII